MSRKNTTGKKLPTERQNCGQKTASQRIAAENELLDQLRSLLPIPEDTRPDKLSVLRLVIAYMKNRQDLSDIIDASARLSLADCDEDSDEVLEGEDDYISDPQARATQKDLACSADIILPDSLVSHIEEQLASREGEKDNAVLQEKLMKYKEGLERGINDFLQQSLPGKGMKYDKNNDVPELRTVAKLNSFTRKKSLLKQEQYVLPKEGNMALEALDGFVIVLTPELTVTYVSSNITRYLGHCPYSVIGQTIELFLHPKDFKKLQEFRDEIVKGEYDKSEDEMGTCTTFYTAMRFCFQTALARLKSTGFSTIKWNIRCRYRFDMKSGVSKLASFVCICQLHHTDAVMDIKLGGTMYVSRHQLDFTYMYCEPNVLFLTGYSSEEIVSRGVFLMSCSCFGFRKKKRKGDTSTSGYYRFMTRDGQWIWFQSQFRTVYSAKGEAQFIESKNHVIRLEDVMQSCYDSVKSKKLGKKALKHSDTASQSKENVLEKTNLSDAKLIQDIDNSKPKHCDMVIPNVGYPCKIRFPRDEIPICKTVSSQLLEMIANDHSPHPHCDSDGLTDVKKEHSSPEGSSAMEILDPFADVQDVLPDCDLNETDLNPLQDVDVVDLLQSQAGHDMLYSAIQETLNDITLPDYNNFNSTNHDNSSELQVLTQEPLSNPSPSHSPQDLRKEDNSKLQMEIVLSDGHGTYDRVSTSPDAPTIRHHGESRQENDRLTQDMNLISRSNPTRVESLGNLFPAMCQNDTLVAQDTTVIDAEIQTGLSFGDDMILDHNDFYRNEVTKNGPYCSARSPFMDFSEFPDSPYTSSISSVNNHSDSEGSTSYLKFSPSSQLTLSDHDDTVNPDTDQMSDVPPDLTDLNMDQCCNFDSGSVTPLMNDLNSDTIFDVYLN